MTNSQKCKNYRAKNNTIEKKKTEALRKKIWRQNLKNNPSDYERYKVSERHRKLKKAQATAAQQIEDASIEPTSSNDSTLSTSSIEDIDSTENTNGIDSESPTSSQSCRSSSPSSSSTSSSPSSFTTKQSLHRSVSRVNNLLPKSPHKKAEVIEKLAKKYQVKFQFKKTSRGRPRKDLDEEEKQWLIDFLSRADLTYTNPGRKDNVYIGKVDGEKVFKQKLYLLWNIKDVLNIANGSGKIKVPDTFFHKFEKELTFSQLYDFLKAHKEYAFNKNIPHGFCLCEICENATLLAKALNKVLENPIPSNPHDLVEKFACNLSLKKCASSQCEQCSTFDFGPRKSDSHSESSSSSSSEKDSADDDIQYFCWTTIEKRITKAKFSLGFEDAVALMKEKIKILKEHISVKRIQFSAYVQQKQDLTAADLLVHVDFAENYKNDQQDEIQSAYFGHQSFSLFTSCCYFLDEEQKLDHKSIVVITESSDHNRITSMSSLKQVVEIAEEWTKRKFHRLIVWSDGMGSQFRSRFVFKILSATILVDKSLSWFYNERHHGKGPMDGVGGTLKNVVFRKVKSNKAVIYNPKEFAEAASQFVPSVITVYMPSESEITEPEGIEAASPIPETLKIHKFERSINQRGDSSIAFYKTAADEEPYYTHWYSKAGGLICDHNVSTTVEENQCAKCFASYHSDNTTDWLECPSCKNWFHEECFYV